jgi:hypothetical protein
MTLLCLLCDSFEGGHFCKSVLRDCLNVIVRRRGYRCLAGSRVRALAIPLVLYLSCTTAEAGSQSLFRLPCTISYDGRASIATNCMLTSSMSQGSMVQRVQTPNGKTFILENDPSDNGKWYLDHEPAVKISEEPNPCYQNQQVKLCF